MLRPQRVSPREGDRFSSPGGGGLGRRSLRYTASAIRLGESTQRSNLSPGGVPDAAASYSSLGEPSEVNLTARRITFTTECRGGWDASASTRRARTDEEETALLLAARIPLVFERRGRRTEIGRTTRRGKEASDIRVARSPAPTEDPGGGRRDGRGASEEVSTGCTALSSRYELLSSIIMPSTAINTPFGWGAQPVGTDKIS